MTRNDWKKVRPRSLTHAFEVSVAHALAVHRRTVPAIAELMGETTSNLYKWMATGRMPAILIPAFEHACGCDFVTRYLASSNGRLVIDIPRGKKADAGSLARLQTSFGECIALLSRFYDQKAGGEETRAGLDDTMRQLAYHDRNVAKHVAPELHLFTEEE